MDDDDVSGHAEHRECLKVPGDPIGHSGSISTSRMSEIDVRDTI